MEPQSGTMAHPFAFPNGCLASPCSASPASPSMSLNERLEQCRRRVSADRRWLPDQRRDARLCRQRLHQRPAVLRQLLAFGQVRESRAVVIDLINAP